MLMRVTWGKIRPGLWDRYETLWNEYTRAVRGTPGLMGRWLLKDSEQADAGYAISLWHSLADFNDYYGKRPPSPELEACFAGEYSTKVCEVRGSDPPERGVTHGLSGDFLE